VAVWHEPVLAEAVVRRLLPRPGLTVLDGTTGTGGHAAALLAAPQAPGLLICLDQDPDVLEVARARLEGLGERVRFHRGSFSELDRVLEAERIEAFDGILLDLGLNSWSLAQPGKGLSYQVDGPLSMELDPDLHLTAGDLLRRSSETELARIFHEFGGVRRSRLYARLIVEARRATPITTTFGLVRVLAGPRPGRLDEAELSRLFQSLRVVVCREMERLESFLERAADWVRPGGRLLILTYAGHEDRRVKRLARPAEGHAGAARAERAAGAHGREAVLWSLLEKPLRPDREEIRRNRRSRSAKLYCFERGGAR